MDVSAAEQILVGPGRDDGDVHGMGASIAEKPQQRDGGIPLLRMTGVRECAARVLDGQRHQWCSCAAR